MFISLQSRLQLAFAISVVIPFTSCFKGEGPPPFIPPTEIRIEASVPGQIYSNKKEIALDAMRTLTINGKKELQFLWSCPVYPAAHPPRIDKTNEAYTIVDSLTPGKYKFQLRVQDYSGHQAVADYDFEVLMDTLSGAPKLGPLPDIMVNLPQSFVNISAASAYDVNPVGRDLAFSWSVILQPAGSGPVTLENKNSPLLTASGLQLGNYVFGVEIRNENGLSVSGESILKVSGDTLTGQTRIYEDLEWELVDPYFDPYSRLTITDPGRFKYRSDNMVELRLWQEHTQTWSDPVDDYYYHIYDNQIFVIYLGSYSDVQGRKTKLQVRFL